MVDFIYPFKEQRVGNSMMLQMFQYKILKSNHLLFDELFKQKKHIWVENDRKSHATLKCPKKWKCYCRLMLRLQNNKRLINHKFSNHLFPPWVIISTLQFSCRGVVCWLKWRENCALDKELGCSFIWETLNQWAWVIWVKLGPTSFGIRGDFESPPSSHTALPLPHPHNQGIPCIESDTNFAHVWEVF
jgi:hypothetical protein